MRKSKRAALWERLHERIARRVLSLMIELEGLCDPKEVICHEFNRVQPICWLWEAGVLALSKGIVKFSYESNVDA
ncbi:hypothetical protein RHGRI_028838 [Rhododendron griersonianum]|uniref:Uncharacterized protein n=1 Tax=Rhododendron griersonianum TaxID=479676 RepID=A0AAV6IJK3_9ERIC|nr:hypothetical protein RHGRI_028838 [Rhododendron griersonianum]